jgi:hypothetical protein
MASNEIPRSPLERILALAEDMIDGLTTHQAQIGIAQNNAAALTTALDAAKSQESAFQISRATKAAKSAAAQVADSNGRAFIAAVKNVLAVTLGSQWSAEWAAVGWAGPSLAIPSTLDERFGMLPLIKAYFTAHPAKENAPLDITAAKAGLHLAALSTARAALNEATTATGAAKAQRDAAIDALRQRMIALVGELAFLLPGDDPRWYAFGLNRPDDPETPEIPEAPILTSGGPGRVLADWVDSRRAERYRVQTLIGAESAANPWTNAASTEDSDATLAGLASGANLHVRIIAANEAGDSQPSATATLVVS